MNELLIGIPIAFAIAFSIYVYLALRRLVKQTTTLAMTRIPIFEGLRKLARLADEEWTKEAIGIIRLVENNKKQIAKTNPEIITLASMLRSHADSLGTSPEPINPATPKEFYRIVGYHLEAYLDAQSKGNKTKAMKEMLDAQVFMDMYPEIVKLT
jgi:hypothetical protein